MEPKSSDNIKPFPEVTVAQTLNDSVTSPMVNGITSTVEKPAENGHAISTDGSTNGVDSLSRPESDRNGAELFFSPESISRNVIADDSNSTTTATATVTSQPTDHEMKPSSTEGDQILSSDMAKDFQLIAPNQDLSTLGSLGG